MSTYEIDPIIAAAAEAALSDRERAVLAACRPLLAQGRRVYRDAVREMVGGNSASVMAALRTLRAFKLIPEDTASGPGRRSTPRPAPVLAPESKPATALPPVPVSPIPIPVPAVVPPPVPAVAVAYEPAPVSVQAVADYRHAWERVRTLLPRKESLA